MKDISDERRYLTIRTFWGQKLIIYTLLFSLVLQHCALSQSSKTALPLCNFLCWAFRTVHRTRRTGGDAGSCAEAHPGPVQPLSSRENSNVKPSIQLLPVLTCNALLELNASLCICFPLSHVSTQLLANSNLAFIHTSVLKLLPTKLSGTSKSLNSRAFSQAACSLTVANN